MDREEAIEILENVKREHKDNQVYVDLIDYLLDEIDTYDKPYDAIENFYNELYNSGVAPNVGIYKKEYDDYFLKNMDDIFEIFNEQQSEQELSEYNFDKLNWSAFELVKIAIDLCLRSFDYMIEED